MKKPFILLSLFLLLAICFINYGDERGLLNTKDSYVKTLEDNFNDVSRKYDSLYDIVTSDRRLYQLYVAEKYKNLKPTEENIKKFLYEAQVLNPEQTYDAATHETGNGRAGVGRPPWNNHFGMKVAFKRFSWAESRKTNNYAIYKNYFLSYLDYEEYLRAGNKTWRKDVQHKKDTAKIYF